MSQKLGIDFEATTDVPETVDKTKSAVVSMEKQVQDVQKKFSTAFKDIFLAFTAPLVLFNAALNFVSSAIEKRRQEVADAIALAEKGESMFVDKGLAALAQQEKTRKQTETEKKQAEESTVGLTQQYLDQGGMMGWGGNADSVIAEMWKTGHWAKASMMGLGLTDMAKDKDVQEIVKKRAVEGMKEGMPATGTDLRTQQGLSNVIGVGANPVVEAMTQQLEEQRKQTELLAQIANGGPSGNTDFTKEENAPAYKATPYGL